MFSADAHDGTPVADGRATRIRLKGHDSRTRDLVLRAVVERGPITAATLAEEFGLTPTAVRRHLDALEIDGQIRLAPAGVDATGSRQLGRKKSRGRPARAYVAGTVRTGLATEYGQVATAALRYLAEQAGPHAVTAFARQRISQLESRYGHVVAAAGPDVLARARALAHALDADGFAATARPVGPMIPVLPVGKTTADGMHSHLSSIGLQICQGHCPVQEIAEEFPEFCEAETQAFARLLGVHVQRLSTLASGAHACTTYIPGRVGTTCQDDLNGRDGPQADLPAGPPDDPHPHTTPTTEHHPTERSPR
ncbi:hypothetical protein KEM60_01625 [Austwickia sp. TVS 96-490-7B]|uniref:helix-turn-helix transcriptional regulator n=1 Tax=Austwickia sp. TVS 96-490-7B TaxID=2830843 RepID=UPI001DAC293D|nr:HTH domain-containing protein [Austwickia sp. TVS 96-490-7B]MBW3085425.1 hypothetical protein [Austwickia sp. TVS 96-490-7B]